MLQELNVAVHGPKPEWMAKLDEEKREAVIHVEFCCGLYLDQVKQGRHFLHEHPWSARSWALPRVQEVLNHPSVKFVQGHMCRFRMNTHVETKDGRRGLVKRPTGFMSSSCCGRNKFNKKCTGGHAHVPLVGDELQGLRFTFQRFVKQLAEGSPDSNGSMRRWELQRAR